MNIAPYLSFAGDCEAAFQFYERCFGGQPGLIFRYSGSPMAADVPEDWQDKVMHGSLTVGHLLLMGADPQPEHYEAPKGFTLSIQIERTDEAERIFSELSSGGTVVMPLERTFWAARFGVLVDQFGIPWTINCEGTDEATRG